MARRLALCIVVALISPSSGAGPALLRRSLKLNSSNLGAESPIIRDGRRWPWEGGKGAQEVYKAAMKDAAPKEKPSDDYNEETPIHKVAPVIWPGKSAIPVTVEMLIAILWIGLVACVPFFLRLFTGEKSTRTDTFLSIGLWIFLFGGLWLFTNLILFQSVHFDTVRSLTIVECVYLMSQVLTTVGYGDITPAKPRGQVFLGLYVIGAFLVIAVLVSDLIGRLISAAQREVRLSATPRDAAPQVAVRSWMQQRPGSSAHKLMQAFVVYAFFCVTWIIFFYNYPGEEKTLMQCIYMSVITLSTVGFGAYTPFTEAGKVFGAFWMVFGSVSMVAVITEFTEWVAECRAQEAYSEQVNEKAVAEWTGKNLGKTKMSEADFYSFYLAHKGYASDDQMKMFRDTFASFKGNEGTASTQAIIEHVRRNSRLLSTADMAGLDKFR